ncbi:CYTH domain-containing protein [Rhizobium sp. FKY42]|uniref:CYTH domain-containing protein n=1 Tax=Rhizobium sp. FKY42 TaxID=2562310 RepID=UPI0010C12CC3|nr:CYTH domain-containing protein [Rhizobium sp. FKY42]
MAKEIERKFLVRSDEWRTRAVSSAKLMQAYITVNEDRNVRVRLIDGTSARLTIKVGKSAMVRDEFEYEIPVRDAEDLTSSAIGIVIEKVRYRVPVAGRTFEIDVYGGFYSGLVVAEVELESEEDHFERPSWLGDEVTGDRRYSNMMLATNDLASELIHGVSHQAL